MKLRLATLCTLLIGSAALAQTAVPRLAIVRVDNPNLDTYTFGAGQCNDTLTVGWSNTLTISLASTCSMNPLKIWSTVGECGNAAGPNDHRYDDVPSLTLNSLARQGTFLVKISELPDFQASSITDGGTFLGCGSATPFTTTHRICAAVDYAVSSGIACGTTSTMTATPLKLVYDTKPPTAPTITSYAAQDKGVRMSFTVDSDTTAVIIEAMGPTDTDYRELAETASSNGTIRGEKLENNIDYLVRLRARDDAGNVSDPTDSIKVTPILTYGFWGYYKNAGGTEQGGCSVGEGLMPLMLAVFALRRVRRQS